MDKVKPSLEDKLETLKGPAMPPAVEARILRRLYTEAAAQSSRRAQNLFRVAPHQQKWLLLLLLAAAAWAVQSSVVPTLRAEWERSHCAPSQPK